jgi:hypothetical protein
MQLLFEDDLVEAVVALATSGSAAPIPALQVRRFHRDRERAYAELDPDARQEAFARVYIEWFSQWGFDRRLRQPVDALPLLARSLDVLAFRKARRPADEGSELYRNSQNRSRGVVALDPRRFRRDSLLEPFLNHELMHLHDMVDPGFGYTGDLDLPGRIPAQVRLVRERYRLLWDLTIDGRLAAVGRPTIAAESRRRAEFDLGFSFLPSPARIDCFNRLWTDPLPCHDRLVSIASDPRELGSNPVPVPGAGCPMCGFPTFDWIDPSRLSDKAMERVHLEFPGWQPAAGLCGRCFEIYAAGTMPMLDQPIADHASNGKCALS